MVAVEKDPDCTRTRLPKSSNSTSFPGGRATLDSPGISSLPCQSIIVPHCPPSFRHSLNSIRTYIIQPDSSSSISNPSSNITCIYKDNRCTLPPSLHTQPPHPTSYGGVSIISRFRQQDTSIASSTRRTGLLTLVDTRKR